QAIAPRFHGGVLDVLGELREDEVRVFGCRGECFYFLDRGVGSFLVGYERKDGVAVEFLPYLDMGFRQMLPDPCFRSPGKIQRGFDAELPQIGRCLRTDAPHFLDVEVLQIEMEVVRWDCCQARRLLPFGGKLGNDLVRGETYREREAE